ncbi:zonular occludens toxin domain-containing protein [uncultured Acinetobacter sp.]|uniref:zonular occludens toxin domain-containing protein n=1 Tax=uncultured Acinetobacter sp. TaxID=165433 RepID=UPI00260FAAB8|nr:zonular occludens toxin domain-containing protein [uncultured Acinetobacter sp.]
MSGVGGKVRLITGESFGSGKTYLAVMEAEKLVQKGHNYKKIYSNIRGHAELAKGITDMPKDWRECDHYSLVIMDEIQFNEKFGKHFSSRRDSEIVDFTQLRHNHIDVWLITPNTKLINTDIKEMVSEHYYIEVASKKVSKCYVFKRAQTNITKNLKATALDTFTYKIEEKYWKLYKSTKDGEASDRQTHFNMNLVTFVVGAVFTLCIIAALCFYLFGKSKDDVDAMTTDKNGNKVQPNITPESSSSSQTKVDTPQDLKRKIEDCQIQLSWTKEMCIDAFDKNAHDQRISELSALNPNDMNTITAKYNPNKPYDIELPEQMPITVNDMPRMSGVLTVRGGKLMAVNQYGDYMPEISQEDCRKYLNGYRPFDYSGARKAMSTGEIGMTSIKPIDNSNQAVENVIKNNDVKI